MIITKKNIETYLKGSLFLGTGGGLPYKVHKKIFDDIFQSVDKISVVSLDDFDSDDILVSAYGVGDPSIIPDNFSETVKTGFTKFQKLTGISSKGIIPGEIGAEGLAFQIGQYTKLPVVDSDLVGGRAAPEIQLDVFSIFNLNIAPVLLVSTNGKSLFLDGAYDAIEIEKISRNFFTDNGSSGVLIGYGISVEKYKKYAMKNTLSYVLQVGELLDKKNTDILASKISASIAYRGMITDVSLSSEGGFLVGKIQLEGGVMNVKNENISFSKKNGKELMAPDILMFVDENCNPIHNTMIKNKVGKCVTLLHIPAQGYWTKNKAKKLWKE